MCGLGHHQDGPDIAPVGRKRRHSDGAVTRAVAREPHKVLKDRKANKHEELRAQLRAEAAGEPFEPFLHPEQFELIPSGLEYLPDYRVREVGLPPPHTLYYSSASEKD